MFKLNKVPLSVKDLIAKLNQYAYINKYKIHEEYKKNHLIIKFFNKDMPGIINVFQTPKGLTIDGSKGHNLRINEDVIKFINEIIAGQKVSEDRISIKNVNLNEYHEIKKRLNQYLDVNSFISLTIDKDSDPNVLEKIIITDKSAKEKIRLLYYNNNTIYVNGFNIYLGDEVLNIIARSISNYIPIKHDILNKLIHKCNEAYITDDGAECKLCDEMCQGDCYRLLRDIHYGKKTRYKCKRVINFYLPKYAYRYAHEIEMLLQINTEIIKEYECLRVMSIGCGPATELLGIVKYASDIFKRANYIGIDLNKKWDIIHNFYEGILDHNVKVKFYYDDIFKLVSSINQTRKKLNTNIVFFQYVISDMVKYLEKSQVIKFLSDFRDVILEFLPINSLIIMNDINHPNLTKDIYEEFYSILDNKKYMINRYYFNPQYNNYCLEYGTEIDGSLGNYQIPDYIEERYNPWSICKSAAIVIRKVR